MQVIAKAKDITNAREAQVTLQTEINTYKALLDQDQLHAGGGGGSGGGMGSGWVPPIHLRRVATAGLTAPRVSD